MWHFLFLYFSSTETKPIQSYWILNDIVFFPITVSWYTFQKYLCYDSLRIHLFHDLCSTVWILSNIRLGLRYPWRLSLVLMFAEQNHFSKNAESISCMAARFFMFFAHNSKEFFTKRLSPPARKRIILYPLFEEALMAQFIVSRLQLLLMA